MTKLKSSFVLIQALCSHYAHKVIGWIDLITHIHLNGVYCKRSSPCKVAKFTVKLFTRCSSNEEFLTMYECPQKPRYPPKPATRELACPFPCASKKHLKQWCVKYIRTYQHWTRKDYNHRGLYEHENCRERHENTIH